jgi:PIN domain nuclease of toxin-antitoxin system
VKLLLDTHAFLYWTEDNPRLPRRARAAIARPRTSACISAATIWEIRIKAAKGRLRTDFTNVAEEARAEGMTLVTGDRAFGDYGVPLLWE